MAPRAGAAKPSAGAGGGVTGAPASRGAADQLCYRLRYADSERGVLCSRADTVHDRIFLPRKYAAVGKRVSVSYFKRACRAAGIGRWPNRQHRTLEDRIDSLMYDLCLNADFEQTFARLLVYQRQRWRLYSVHEPSGSSTE